MQTRSRLLFLALPVCVLTAGMARAIESDFTVTAEMLRPTGAYYHATVPDTLDLAERARLSVQGITRFLNPSQNYGPYGLAFLNCKVPYMTFNFPLSKDGGGIPNWGKIAESLMMARIMSGSDFNLEMDVKTLRGMLDYLKPNANVPMSRMMLALIALQQRHADPRLQGLIAQLGQSYRRKATVAGEEAHFTILPARNEQTKAGIWGEGHNVFVHGSSIRAMTHYARYAGDADTLELAGKVTRYILAPQFWTPECAPRAVAAPEHAQFMGSTHSYMACLMGVLAYAQATNDPRLKQFVREGYQYMRTFGLARIGLFAESCTTGDMTYLAIKLSDAGVGDYWDDADSYVRNALAEHQITDAAKLQKAVETAPILERITPRNPSSIEILAHQGLKASNEYLADPGRETEDQVVSRCVGIFLSDMAWPTEIPKSRLMWVICCTGNCTSALYYAWDSIVRCEDGNAQVNLLLNRASPWLDIDSYLPYEGKVVIRNKSARNVSVHIPGWVDHQGVKARRNGAAVAAAWTGRYLVFHGLTSEDTLTITFPMVETHEEYTLLWKNEDFWQESTDPGKRWKPKENPDRFTLHMKGSTVVDITPRPAQQAYPLFDRKQFLKDTAPTIEVQRFISSARIMW